MDALVTAIITTCKRPPSFVTRALKSVMAQTYPHIQIVVVDDSPTDYPEKENVHKTVLELCPQALYISYGENRGAPAARNAGIEAAEGEFIAFLDDDDEWLPEKTEKLLTGFVNEKTALVYGRMILSNDAENTRYVDNQKCFSGIIYEQLLEQCFIGSTSNPIMRRECVNAVGGFDPEMRSAQDYDLYLRLAKRYEVQFIDSSCLIYHIHSDERITTNNSKKLSGYKRLIMKYEADLMKYPSGWISFHRNLIPYYRRTGRVLKALRIWLSTFCKAPLDIRHNIKYFILALATPDFFLYRWHTALKQSIRNRRGCQ